MFESLTDRLQQSFRKLTGRGTLTEANIREAMREVRMALLEADVNYAIVKDFVARVQEECLGERVLKSVTPGQQAVKVVSDSLTSLMGEANVPLDLSGSSPATIMVIGLHGGGKTTTTAKLALRLKNEGKRVLLVAGDVYRPAAVDQLEQLGKQVGVPVFADRESKDVAAIAAAARRQARHEGCNVMVVDTAGRLQIDDDLVRELVRVRDQVTPSEILLVGDAALGQEAVSVAQHFNDALDITGIVLTKLDGDARGGAALSMRQVTGKPIKFVGMGEKLKDLEPFHPDRMASRILGMGDVVSLVEKAAETISEEEAKRLEEKMLKSRFDFEDFLSALQQLRKLGGMRSILDMVPGGRRMLQGATVDERMLKHVEAVVQSMTPDERRDPGLLRETSRRERIARGSGRSVDDVHQLMRRFDDMRGMMSKFGKMMPMMGGGARQVSQRAKKAQRKKNKRKRR